MRCCRIYFTFPLPSHLLCGAEMFHSPDRLSFPKAPQSTDAKQESSAICFYYRGLQETKGCAEQVCSLVPEHNVIMTTISKHSNVKTFTEKLLLLLNRGGECLRRCYLPGRGCRETMSLELVKGWVVLERQVAEELQAQAGRAAS